MSCLSRTNAMTRLLRSHEPTMLHGMICLPLNFWISGHVGYFHRLLTRTIVSYVVTMFQMVNSIHFIITVGNTNANIPLSMVAARIQMTMHDSLNIISGWSTVSTTTKCGDDSLMAASRPLLVPVESGIPSEFAESVIKISTRFNLSSDVDKFIQVLTSLTVFWWGVLSAGLL